MSELQELAERVDRLDRRVTDVSMEAAGARILAAKVDHDIADMKQTLRAHTRSLGALHQTQSEQSQQLRELHVAMHDGFAAVETRCGGIDGRIEGVDRRLDTFHAETKESFAAVNARFEKVDERFDKVDARFDQMESRFDELVDLIKRSGKTA
jgi:tetrahydromethanopterin S-methyltransferase subunit G